MDFSRPTASSAAPFAIHAAILFAFALVALANPRIAHGQSTVPDLRAVDVTVVPSSRWELTRAPLAGFHRAASPTLQEDPGDGSGLKGALIGAGIGGVVGLAAGVWVAGSAGSVDGDASGAVVAFPILGALVGGGVGLMVSRSSAGPGWTVGWRLSR